MGQGWNQDRASIQIRPSLDWFNRGYSMLALPRTPIARHRFYEDATLALLGFHSLMRWRALSRSAGDSLAPRSS